MTDNRRAEFVRLLKNARDVTEQHWQPGRYKDEAFARVLAAYDAASSMGAPGGLSEGASAHSPAADDTSVVGVAPVPPSIDAASQPVAGEAVAWLIPSSSGREPNDRGFIDAMAWSDGEFTMPVYTHPAPKADAAAPDGWSVTEDAANNRIHFSIGVQTFTLDWVPDEQPETRRPWMAGMLRKALTRLAAAPPAPPAAEARAKSDLYYAVNEMMAHLGAAGEIDTRHRSVTKVMAELERIDSGAPDNATATDAERYLFLRERDLDSISNGGVFAGLTPKNVVLNGDDLDRAIDAAMSGGKGATRG